jgi:hypothetical protein
MIIPKRTINPHLSDNNIKLNLDLDYIPITSILQRQLNSYFVDNAVDFYKASINNYFSLTYIHSKDYTYINRIDQLRDLKQTVEQYFAKLYQKLYNDIRYTSFCSYVHEAKLNTKISLSYLANNSITLKKEYLVGTNSSLDLYKSYYDKKEKVCFYLIGNYMLFDLKYDIIDDFVESNDAATEAINDINNKIEIRSINFKKHDLQYVLTINKDYAKYGIMFENVDPKYLRLYVNKSYVDNPNLKSKIDKTVIPYYEEQNVEIVYEESLDYFINKPIERPKKIGEDLSKQVLKRFASCLKQQ